MPTPLRKQRGSVELLNLCDNSTIASSRHTNSFACSTSVSHAPKPNAYFTSPEDRDKSLEGRSVSPFQLDTQPDLETIKEKLRLQELRLHTFLKKLKERDAELRESDQKNKRLSAQLADSNAQVALYKAKLNELEEELRETSETHSCQITRANQHKDAEVAKLKEELSMLKAQFQAKVEAEVSAAKATFNKLQHPEVLRLTKELDLALAKVKYTTSRNVQLQDEIGTYQEALKTLKGRTENGNVYVGDM